MTRRRSSTSPITIGPGLYYIAACVASTSLQFTRVSATAPIPLSQGLLSATYGDSTLPSTASPSADQTLAYIPIMFIFLEGTVA